MIGHSVRQAMAGVSTQTSPVVFLTTGVWMNFTASVSGNHVIKCWGCGGKAANTTAVNQWRGGAAGGQFAQKTLYLNAGEKISIWLQSGGYTFVKNEAQTVTHCSAQAGAASTSGTGALGSTLNGVGDIVYAGGNGGTSVVGMTGAGGGGAGTTGAGGTSTGGNAGTGTTISGGNGAAGRSTDGNGAAGSACGGGGAGAVRTGTTNRTGGSGGAGRCEISW